MRYVAFCAATALLCFAAEPGFKPLFNGKNLEGWDGDPRLWRVEHGEIVGKTDGIELEDNSFLISKKEYGDFVLRLKMKLRNHNSGVQFRSEALPKWVVRGYQADAAEDNWWGGIYEEKGKRGVMVNGWKGKAEKVVRQGDWNDYEIRAQGDHIQIRLNGLLTAELHDSERLKGIIALQLHKGPGMEARFKDIRIQELR
jgi:hypothetical protein